MNRKGATKIIIALVLAVAIALVLIVYTIYITDRAASQGDKSIDKSSNPINTGIDCEGCLARGSTPEKCGCEPAGSRSITIDTGQVSFSPYTHNQQGGPWYNTTLPEGVSDNADHIYWVCMIDNGNDLERYGPFDCYVNKTEDPEQLVCHNDPTGSGCEEGTIQVKWWYG